MFKKVAQQLITQEHARACNLYPPFHSPHEGLAILQQEFEELKREVFKNPNDTELASVQREAAQVGAMALRFLIDCT